jgi:predicted nucleic acid-binding protein
MTALDASVVVAAGVSWHEHHELARQALPQSSTRPVAHVLLEAYSALTRLPAPQRVRPTVARQYLGRLFTGQPRTLPPDEHEGVLDDVSAHGLLGGAVYDALVGATARHGGVELLTLDRRALGTYRAVGARVSLLG